MRKSSRFFLIAIALMVAGATVYYLYGYKESFWVQGISYCLVIFGWLLLLFPLIGFHIRLFERLKDSRVTRDIVNFLLILAYPVWLAAMVAGFVWLEYRKDDRVREILSTGTVRFTEARVIRVETRRLKSVSHRYAIFAYKAAGSDMEQALKDDDGLYDEGQKFTIRYSERYPDMFAVSK